MNFLKSKLNNVANSAIVSKIRTPSGPFPIVDTVITVYAAVTLLFQVLFQISPVMSFFVNTPFYQMQTYLGLLGGALIVLDLFTTKKIWSGKYSFFLYCILFIAAISSVRMISYGIKENLFKLCWMAVQFILIYTVSQRMDRDSFKKFVKIVFFTILAIWTVCCCISLYQYINQIGYTYVVNPLGKDSSANRQGFYDNRLFGIFYTLNTAATFSLLLFLANLFFIFKAKNIALKITLCLAEVFLISHLILSGSRSAALCLFAAVLVLTWFLVRNKIETAGMKKLFIPIIAALAGITVCIGGFYGIKTGLSYLPYLNEKLQTTLQKEDPSTDLPEEDPTPEFPKEEIPSTPESSVEKTPAEPWPSTEKTPAQPEYDKDILDRDNLEGNLSNDRFEIWGDYVSLYEEIGLLGLSPGNYMPYVIEHHPELFIVEDIRIEYPDKYESGIIYHGHSGYLIVFIATGFLGLFALLAFIGLCIYRVIKTVLKNKKLSSIFICAFLFVVVCALTAALDEGLFFQNSPQTTLFYFALGLLMNTSFHRKSSADEALLSE